MMSDDLPEDLIEYQLKTKAMLKWNEQDILRLLDRISATREETHNLLVAIISALQDDDLEERELGRWRA